MSAWRPALRIARRTTRRNIGRSLLVAVLVGLPVAGATFADLLYRSTSGPEHETYREIGTADAQVTVTTADALPDGWQPQRWGYESEEEPSRARDPRTVDLATFLPAGSRVVPARRYADVKVALGEGFVRSEAPIIELGDPLTEHLARLDAGNWPTRSDEAVITRPLAERLDLFDGGTLKPNAKIEIVDGPAVSVTGISIDPFWLDNESIMAMPGSDLADHITEAAEAEYGDAHMDPYSNTYFVDLPDGADAKRLWPDLAEAGIAMIPREVYLEPEPSSMNLSMEDVQAFALSALIVGLGLLEIVLLAGAAFAVGAKRQTRDLGLAAVNGATTRHVRRIVLAQGLTLGAIGAALGVAFGALAAVVAKPLWERLLGQLINSWRFGWGEIAIAAGVGVVSGLAAAVIPAVGAARMKPFEALAGRFRASKLATRMPVFGVILIALGIVTAFAGNRLIAGDFAAYKEALETAGPGQWVPGPDATMMVTLLLLGAVLAVAGIVISIPALIAALARLRRRSSFTFRYAMRDAARHRHRTAPTIAAIMIVVAGSVSLAFVLGGSDRADELRHNPSLPDGVMNVSTDDEPSEQSEPGGLKAATVAAQEKLPEATVVDVTKPYYDVDLSGTVAEEEGEDGSASWPAVATPEPYKECTDQCLDEASGTVAASSPELFEMIAGRSMNADEQAAIASGAAIIFDPTLVSGNDTIFVGVDPYLYDDPELKGAGLPQQPELDAHVVALEHYYYETPQVLVPAEALPDEAEFRIDQSLLAYGDASDEDVTAAITAAELQGAWVYIEETPQSDADGISLILAGGSAFVTLVGVAIAVSLAAAEGRADYATLSAVGAAPRRRRLVSGAQALVVAGAGTGLGLAFGTFFAYTAWPATGSPDFLVPWSNLALTSVAVPLLAVLVAMIFTPSRLPMMRRLE